MLSIREAQYRHAAHYLNVLATAYGLYKSGTLTNKKGIKLLVKEWLNIQAGQAWSEAHWSEDQRLAWLCSKYSREGVNLLDLTQPIGERIRWFESALAAANHLKIHEDECSHLDRLALTYADVGKISLALQCSQRAIDLAREIGERRFEAEALSTLGIIYKNSGESRLALQQHEKALEIFQETHNRRGEGKALGNIGLALAENGDYSQAIEFFQKRLVISQETHDRHGEGNALGNIGGHTQSWVRRSQR